ncbi:LysE family translocator [Pseudokineococcus sp. 1T1Z-3]|uniref:LysE family translocator n=1 Tax=Pseudokineococcus sp. 1T1Z-3 TaxID=3132745 RepID=UPI0030B1369C
MPPVSNLVAFTLAAVVLVAVPGPSVLFVVGRSLAAGRRVGLVSVVGNALGMVPQVLAVAVGVGALVAQSVVAFTVLKTVGALYLVYLGVQAIRHRHVVSGASQPDALGLSRAVPTLKVLREGFLVGLSNPKSVVFFVAVLPQFTSATAGSVWSQVVVLGGVFLVVALVLDSFWALAAGTARVWLTKDPRRLPRLGATGGVMMIGLGGMVAVADRPS